MVRFVFFMAVLLTLGVLGGPPLPATPEADVNTGEGLHARHTSSYSKKVYCDSYDCPYRWIPIDDDDEVKCKWGKCTKSQCGDTVRSSYHCPKYYELTDDTYTTVCEYDKCTEDQCCETSLMCNKGIDKRVQCCRPIPSFYTCPTNYARESGMDNVECNYSV